MPIGKYECSIDIFKLVVLSRISMRIKAIPENNATRPHFNVG